jgi:hypothetical protein
MVNLRHNTGGVIIQEQWRARAQYCQNRIWFERRLSSRRVLLPDIERDFSGTEGCRLGKVLEGRNISMKSKHNNIRKEQDVRT